MLLEGKCGETGCKVEVIEILELLEWEPESSEHSETIKGRREEEKEETGRKGKIAKGEGEKDERDILIVIAFLMALGVSILLQSIERFIEPKEIERPILVMAVGAGGIGSNIIMLLFLGGGWSPIPTNRTSL